MKSNDLILNLFLFALASVRNTKNAPMRVSTHRNFKKVLREDTQHGILFPAGSHRLALCGEDLAEIIM